MSNATDPKAKAIQRQADQAREAGGNHRIHPGRGPKAIGLGQEDRGGDPKAACGPGITQPARPAQALTADEEVQQIAEEVRLLLGRAVRQRLRANPSAADIRAAMDWLGQAATSHPQSAYGPALDRLRAARASGSAIPTLDTETDDPSTR